MGVGEANRVILVRSYLAITRRIPVLMVCLGLAACSGMPALPQEYVELCAKEAKTTYFRQDLPLPAKKIAFLRQHGFASYCHEGCRDFLIDGYTHVQMKIPNPRPVTFTDKPGIYQYSFRKIGDPLCRGFEQYIEKHVKPEYRSLRLGLKDRCIATEEIKEFDADVIYQFKNTDIITKEDYVVQSNQIILKYTENKNTDTVIINNSYSILFSRINSNTGTGYNAACRSEGFSIESIFKPVGHEFAFNPPGYTRYTSYTGMRPTQKQN